MTDIRYAIIGGGVIGRALAHALSRAKTGEVVVIEKSRHDQIENQSTRNSGVIHGGNLYKKTFRPRKARLCVEGNRLLYEFCAEQGVHHARCGKLVVATNEMEEGYLDAVQTICRENRVPGVAMLSAEEARAMEPNVVASKALHVPSSGVVDAVGYVKKLRECAASHDLFDTNVVGIRKVAAGFEIRTLSGKRQDSFVAETVINAAGLYSDEIARMINPDSPYEIFPVRGEAAKFYKTRRDDLQMRGMNVYPAPYGFYNDTGRRARVPYEEYEKLLAARVITDTVGVHLTPTLDEEGKISKTVTVGPGVATGVEKDDYGKNLYPPSYFWERVRAFFPSLRASDLELHQAGIQAKLKSTLDWVIEADPEEGRFINLVGIDSPGLTGSLAIARHVVEDLLD